MPSYKGKYKIVLVEERFTDEKGLPRERLSCGHVRLDPICHYGNETAFKIKRAFEMIGGGAIKARCYKCAIDKS